MFDEVTKQEGGKAAARRAGYVMGSTAFQIALVFGIIALSATLKAKVLDEQVVDVKFVRPATPPPPPPPPAPPARRSVERPKSDTPRPPPPPPQALLQPKDVQEQMKAPDPNEKPEPEYDYDSGGEGVVGGVVGAGQIEEAPAYATSGYVKPRQAQVNCVQNSVRIPQGFAGYVSGPVTVKFAVRADGSVSQFQVPGNPLPNQVVAAIWQAVQGCQWIAGTDPRGKPTSIWVILPIRFTQ